MLIFIDESGDPGFKLDKGATPIFVAAMVMFSTGEDAAATEKVILESEARRLHKPEFKFSKCSNDIRDMFFGGVCGCPFRVRAIVVRKELIRSPKLMTDKESFYEFFVRSMLKFDNGTVQNAKVRIDGSGDKEFRQRLDAALRQRLRDGAIADLRFKKSHGDVLIQLADMCAGAIARSYRDRKHNDRWRKMLRPRINDIWDFR
jgi:hypothetical protein